MWLIATVSLSLGCIVCATHFLSLGSKHFNMSLKRKEYKVNDCVENKAARFFITCQENPDTKMKMTEAMRVKGYSNNKAANLTLQMQVHCMIARL